MINKLHLKGTLSRWVLTTAAALLISTSAYATQAHAAELCATGNCVLACSSRLHICSLFPRTRVPSGYVRVSFMPYGYRRVRQTSCDNMVCPSYVKDCRRWVPTDKGN